MPVETQGLLQAVGPATRTRHTVLVVHDDDALADALSPSLPRGFAVVTARPGPDALDRARSAPPSLIVLDVRRSDMDGLAFCHELAAARGAGGIPVIVLSAMTRPDIIRRSHRDGVAFFVRKPFDPDALAALICQAIDEYAGL